MLSSSRSSKAIRTLVPLSYAFLLLLVIPRHESWADEQTAWILASTHSPWQLASTILRHEGTPGLWHGLLWMLARMHLPFFSAHILAGVAAFAGVYVLVHFAPFPLWLRALLPFTFFLLYQYAVVARQYVFFPVFVFSLAALACGRRWHPHRLALVAGLLANLSLHGFVFVAGSLLAFGLLRSRLPSATRQRLTPRQNRSAAFMVAAAMLFATATALPIPHRLHAAPAAQSSAAASSSITEPALVWHPRKPAGMNRVQDFVWRHSFIRKDTDSRFTRLRDRGFHAMIRLFGLMAFPIANSNLLAFAFLLAVCLELRRRQALVLLLPWLLIIVAMLATQVYEHHTGLLFIALLFALWISMALHPSSVAAPMPLPLPLLALFAVVVILQVGWGLFAAVSDIRQPYTGDEDAAGFLEPIYRQTTVALGPITDGFNAPHLTHSFESPSITAAVPPLPNPDGHQQLDLLRRKLALHPQIVAEAEVTTGTQSLVNQLSPMWDIGGSEVLEGRAELLRAAGYHETHRFCGRNFMRQGWSRVSCTVLYEPGQAPDPATH